MSPLKFAPFVVVVASLLLGPVVGASAEKPFEIRVMDAATGRGVPLVELESMDNQLYVTDSAGRIAFSQPGQMGVPVWFSMRSHGYEFPMDGFGMTGQRLIPGAGEKVIVRAKRLNIAERICRLTGYGIYRDSVLLGEKVPLADPLLNGGVVGQDSVHTAIYHDRIFWLWGDTMRLSYPLGNFRTVCAVSDLPGKGGLPPSSGVNLRYFTGKDGFAKEMCPLERKEGVVWLAGLAVVPDENGVERLVASYSRRGGLEKVFEQGVAMFSDEKEIFDRASTIPNSEKWRFPNGHTTVVSDGGTEYLYFGDSVLNVRVPRRLRDVLEPASYEAWTCADAEGRPRRRADGALDYAWRKDAPPVDPQVESEWLKKKLIQPDECRVTPVDVATNDRVKLHAGTVRWNAFRNRWVLIAVQQGGKSSFLGEVWYAEAKEPTGPWKSAVKVASHDRYSFYNPAQHPFFDEEGGRVIYFEGTYSHTFSRAPFATPLYDYNQIQYRLDLTDPRLQAAQE